ncbi:hypothetical protein ACFPOE_23460 [Caenimonas terrae]|uniref:Glycosyltransferase RgtA/B/C/D-like domain-containing protein n=1 Tax=Caenimonas terrae TaxID=696074 RepID=A0ABW0NJR2_9BURK
MHRPLSSVRLAEFIDRHQATLACVIATLFLLALHYDYNFTRFHYDSDHYWALATFENLRTERSIRGYFFPALLTPLHYLTTVTGYPLLTYRAGMSLTYGVLLTTLLPAAFRQAFGGRLSVLRRLVPVVLLAILFPGMLLYPLSDLPAVLLAFTALMCALRGLAATGSRKRFIGMLFAAGILMGAAYNTRTIYLFGGVPLGLLTVLTIRGAWAKAPFPRWVGLAAFAAGVLLVSLPQAAINKYTHGVNSLAVQSDIDNKSLFATQLVRGMTLQRYETTLYADALSSHAYYFDPAGAKLFRDTMDGGDLFSLRYYLKVVVLHPLDFLALYSRHVINGLDVRDGLVYTHKPSPLRNRTALFNFLVLALAAWVAVSVRARTVQPGDSGWRAVPASWPISLALVVLPVLAIVPGGIETRFFLPLHMLAYCVIAFHFDAQQLRRDFALHWRILLASLLLAAGTFFAVTLSTMATHRYDWPEPYSHQMAQ